MIHSTLSRHFAHLSPPELFEIWAHNLLLTQWTICDIGWWTN